MTEQLTLFQDSGYQRFWRWAHSPEGREVSSMFIRLAVRMLNRGFRHYSAQALIERIRWHHDLRHGPGADGFKINHNYRSYLARFAMEQEPRLRDFFETRAPDCNKPRRAVVIPIQERG